jgi:hypothetical protein
MLKQYLLNLLKDDIIKIVQAETAQLRYDLHTIMVRSAEREQELTDIFKEVIAIIKTQPKEKPNSTT